MHGLLLALALDAAAASPIELTWTGDAGCSRAQFEASLADYLGEPAAPEPLQVQVHLRKRNRWTLTLTLGGVDGKSVRQLNGPSCASVSEAAAFITAVAIDPSVVDRAGAPRGGEPTPSDPPEVVEPEPSLVPPAPLDAEDAVPAPSPPVPVMPPLSTPPAAEAPLPSTAADGRRRPPRGFVRLAGGLEALGMPGVGGQVQAAAGPLGRHWRVELRGLYRAPTSAFASDDPAAGGKIGLWTVGTQGCGVLRPSVLEVPLCAGVEVGQALGSGFGFADARPSRLLWAAVTVGGALAWAPRRWLALWLGLELGVPLVRGSFGIGGLGVVHRIGAVSPRAALGIELRFP